MSDQMVTASLNENIHYMKMAFADCADVVMNRLLIGSNELPIFVVYMDSMYDRRLIDGDILKNLLYDVQNLPQDDPGTYLMKRCLPTADVKQKDQIQDAVDEVLKGNTALFAEHMPYAIIISSKDLPGRGVQDAETEVSVRGSKESFTESFRINTVLIRRRIRDTKLKSIQKTVGRRSKTDVAVMYMEDLVRPNVLKQIESALDELDIDAVLDISILEQMTEESWASPFPQYQSTERPDKAASALLEGRVVLVADNSPQVLMIPAVMACFFQASDDYYDRWDAANFIRVLRYLAAFLAMLLPSLYLVLAGYHPEVLPMSFALSLAVSREGVPFTLPVEILLMELAFELLREAGIRLPGPMGGTLGIVGGLIIGQAAVDAHIVSPAVVIVVALTALAAFTIPNDLFASGFRMMKFYCLLMSAVGDLTGLVTAVMTISIHLAGLTSFGFPYMIPFVSGIPDENGVLQDSIMKAPADEMEMRPSFTKRGHRRRMRRREDHG